MTVTIERCSFQRVFQKRFSGLDSFLKYFPAEKGKVLTKEKKQWNIISFNRILCSSFGREQREIFEPDSSVYLALTLAFLTQIVFQTGCTSVFLYILNGLCYEYWRLNDKMWEVREIIVNAKVLKRESLFWKAQCKQSWCFFLRIWNICTDKRNKNVIL